MRAKKHTCWLIETKWLTPTVMQLRFQPKKRFDFDPGQFLSILVPPTKADPRGYKRAYSFASGPGQESYELCVKYVPGGKGTEYLKSLKPGDTFTAFAPYGDFTYKHKPGRSVCFIATGSGIAPFRSIVLSSEYQENPPERALILFGAREEKEIIFPGFFEQHGLESVVAVSRPGPDFSGFRGRVTDYLRTLPSHFGWHTTDFYICGNSEMALEVASILKGQGVPEANVHLEVFFLQKRNSDQEEAVAAKAA